MRAKELRRSAKECTADLVDLVHLGIITPKDFMFAWMNHKRPYFLGPMSVRVARRILRLHRKYFPVRQ